MGEQVRRRAAAMAAVVLVVGCGVDVEVTDGPDDGSELTMGTWDLRETNDIEAIGWPEELTMSATEVRSADGLERILLPGGVELAGFDRANPSRSVGPDGQLGSDLESLVVAYTDRAVADTGALAESLAEQLGIDAGGVGPWVQRNRDQPDRSPGGSDELLVGPPLDDGVEVSLRLRAVEGGEAGLFVTVLWEGQP